MEPVEFKKLHVPSLDEVADIFQQELRSTFSFIDVKVVDCPNLKEKPFMLSAEGLCGHPSLADVGGVPNLVPLAQPNKIYNLRKIAKDIKIPNAFIIGAGAGPRHHIGVNCEMMPNIKFGQDENNGTYIAKLGKNNECKLEHIKFNEEFCLLANLFISEGQPGKVIKVHAKERIGSDNFVTAMRKILANTYKDKPIGIGGVFLIKTGKAKLHIMPDYSKTPLNNDEDLKNWLKYFDMNAPLVCLSTFISHDPDLDLRVEHTHCFSDHGEGGHYHIDTTPDIVEYEGYFNLAEYIYRIDRPEVTHQFGRD